MKAPRPKRLILIGALILTLGVAACVVLSLRNDDSILSIVVRDVMRKMPWAPDSTTFDVLGRMAKYEKRGRYDDAINAGIAWTEKHPENGSNDWIFRHIALLCLEKARKDSGHADEYIRRAMLYRDKALPFESDSISSLRDVALFSEAGGDLSASQRCVHYRNAIKLLEHLGDVLRERRAVAPKEEAFVAPRQGTSAEYVLTVEDINALLERTNGTMTRVKEKLQKSGCK